MPRIYIALDIETTGLNADRDAIIEIGAVKFRGDDILDTWSSLVNPGRALPRKIERLTGITSQEVERAPSLFSVTPTLKRFIGENPVVGHNIAFDLGFLQRTGLNVSAALDTFELACILMPYASRYSLGKLMDELGIAFPTRHRALEDARAAAALFGALLQRAGRLDQKIIQEIARLGDKSDWALKFAFQDLLRDHARTAFAPGSIGAQLAAKGGLGDETLGLIFSRDPKEQPLKPKTHQDPLDVDALAQLLEPAGAFAGHFPGYEHRAQQVEMLRAVAHAFNDGATLLAEAGTGTGKSLAYLLPAIYWGAQNNQRIVISTATINLQDQLFEKDIPDLRNVLPVEFKAALLKGRANYLCRRRLDALRKGDKLTTDQVRVLAKTLAWLPSTTTGDNAELRLMGAENAVWSQLSSDQDHCAPQHCALRQENKCFFYRAREKAEGAHIIIVNHALLLSDMATENRVLPEHVYLIVDEAHHLEARATDALAFEASRSSLETLLRGFANERGGLIGGLAGALRNSDVPAQFKRDVQNIFTDVAQDVDHASRGVYDFFTALENFIAQQEQLPGESSDSNYDRQLRLTATRRAQPAWSAIEIAWDDFGARLTKTRDGLDKIYKAWDDLDEYAIPSYPDLQTELSFAIRRLGETRGALEALITKPQSNGIYWVNIGKKNEDVSLHVAPLYVGEMLQKQLFAGKQSVILTSATMCVDKKFTHIKSRLGIGDWANDLTVGSPFDYKTAAAIFVPTDLPEPGQPNYQKSVEAALIELFRATEGRAMTLFTSHAQLQNTYRAISRPLEEDGIVVLAQNLDGSRKQVLETFKTQARTVLLGTRSFWEGVDVAGDALSCLVIARLPFSVPSDPIFAARSETFDDSFAQYAVPEAVLRFRQGFGRLIRAKTDRGIVVVLDKRVLTKNYGRIFLASLPPVSKFQGPLKEMPTFAAKWINGS
jgi:DNA polymerase-3 subunit epsilon/ATP-dependent DNA helicase DinG